jgi:hypothetical protein
MLIPSKTKQEWFPQAGMVRVKLERELLEESFIAIVGKE